MCGNILRSRANSALERHSRLLFVGWRPDYLLRDCEKSKEQRETFVRSGRYASFVN